MYKQLQDTMNNNVHSLTQKQILCSHTEQHKIDI